MSLPEDPFAAVRVDEVLMDVAASLRGLPPAWEKFARTIRREHPESDASPLIAVYEEIEEATRVVRAILRDEL